MSRSFWERFAFLYDLAEGTNAKAVRGMVTAVAQQVPAGASVLECAAGTGEISLAAAPKAGHVLCTDLSRAMLDRAFGKARRLGLANVDFALRDLLHLTDPDECFDVVIAANVLHLLDAPEAAIRELWRVTRPGGLLILPTFLMGEAGLGFRVLIRLYRLLGFRSKREYTPADYRAMVEGCGLGSLEYSVVPGRLPVGLAVLTKPFY